ncbi:MAG TPA: hypothetical protein DDY13_12370 [Cytophagales bacterium]|nr:hypothetical protein [Cytophagales bacterium]
MPIFYTVLASSFALVCIMIVILTAFKKNKSKSEYYLIAIFTVFFLHMAIDLTRFYYKEINWYPHLVGLTSSFSFLYGPLFYYYFLSLTGRKGNILKRYWVFLLPFIIYFLINIPFILLDDNLKDEKFAIWMEGEFRKVLWWLNLVKVSFHFVFIYLIWKEFKVHRKNLKKYFSHQSDVLQLLWFRKLIQFFVVIAIGAFVGNILSFGTEMKVYMKYDDLMFVIATGSLIYLFIYGIRHTDVFREYPDYSSLIVEDKANVELKRKLVSDEQEKDIRAKLEKAMEEDHLYLNPELSLNELAAHIGEKSYLVSAVINDMYDKTFFQYVNEKRVAHFKEIVKLPESKNLTLFGVASESGFNSKASFNRIVKQLTGMTPSELVKSN